MVLLRQLLSLWSCCCLVWWNSWCRSGHWCRWWLVFGRVGWCWCRVGRVRHVWCRPLLFGHLKDNFWQMGISSRTWYVLAGDVAAVWKWVIEGGFSKDMLIFIQNNFLLKLNLPVTTKGCLCVTSSSILTKEIATNIFLIESNECSVYK